MKLNGIGQPVKSYAPKGEEEGAAKHGKGGRTLVTAARGVIIPLFFSENIC